MATRTGLIQCIEAHHFDWSEEGGVLFVHIPWSRRVGADFETGVELEPVHDFTDLLPTLGY